MKQFDLEKLMRPDLRRFVSYSAHTSPETLVTGKGFKPDNLTKLDANENPYGCSPLVYEALESFRNFNIYPDTDQTMVRQELGAFKIYLQGRFLGCHQMAG